MVRVHVDTETLDFSAPQERTLTKSATEYIFEEDLSDMRPVILIQDQETNEILMAVVEFSEEDLSVNNWELYHDQ